ncbi:MAG: hypothetical protein HY722_13900, partial [Planctomycetes bacterium]|nr:hypothetical protein [Planctomycetota bacterium]
MKDRHTRSQPAEEGEEGRAPAPVPDPAPPSPPSPPRGSTGEFDGAFAEVAVRAGWVDRESVEEALRLKALLKEEDPEDYPSLSQISVECGILTLDQARRLMDVIRHIDGRRRQTTSGVFPIPTPAAAAGPAEAPGPESERFKTQEVPALSDSGPAPATAPARAQAPTPTPT